MINIQAFANEHHIKFGTSGIRSLNTLLTDKVCYVYTFAFLRYLENTQQITKNSRIILAGDLRSNTDHILEIINQAIIDDGYLTNYCGKIPTPALCNYSIQENCPGIMVTGSHIPADMNGIKYYKKDGEILKIDEKKILLQSFALDETLFDQSEHIKKLTSTPLTISTAAYNAYLNRYLDFFPANCLQGLKIGLYAHSSVAIKPLHYLLQTLGATVTPFGDAATFHPIDTEALAKSDIELAEQYISKYGFNCIVSTDGDGDRPLVTDEYGQWVHGDIVGMICAHILNAKYVVTPLTCNSSIDLISQFTAIYRTRIGSPYVIEKMNELIEKGCKDVIGFESNGGVLVGTSLNLHHKTINALPTRDSILPILSILFYINQKKITISNLINTFCYVYTISDSIKQVSPEISQALFQQLKSDPININQLLNIKQAILDVDITDGLRVRFNNNTIVYLRQSGNAPELRCYTEAKTKKQAKELNEHCINSIKSWMIAYERK